jgi:hypothetical protein
MKILTTKTKAMITVFLMLTIAATLVVLPTVYGHDPPLTIPTWCYIAVTNNPIGVNQQLNIVFWLNAYPPTASGAYGDRWTFNVEVTKPDDSKETLGPFTSDPVGTGYASYTPTEVGNYSVIAKFAEHKIDGSPNGYAPDWSPYSFGYDSTNDTYQASQSDPAYFTVQQEPIQPWPEPPLPTNSYWAVPVNSANRGWSSLVGNWLGGAAQINGSTTNFAYGTGPESAHVLWTKPGWAGGIMDQRFSDIGYQTEHYDGLAFNPIILDGKIYYNAIASPWEGWYCVDLYTGETEYFHNTTGPVTGITFSGFDYSGGITGESLAFGQIYDYESPNQHGGFPYLWSQVDPSSPNTWMLFDAVTGNYICKIINVPTGGSFLGMTMPWGTAVYGKDGSILRYNIVGTPNPIPYLPAGPPFYLQCWNTSRALWVRPWSANTYWMWRTYLNYTFDGNNGYSLNVTLPWTTSAGSILTVREGEYVIGGTAGKNNGTYTSPGTLWALSLKPGSEGTLLWNITYTPPATAVPDVVSGGIFAGGLMSGPATAVAFGSNSKIDPEDGVFLFNEPMTRRWWGYSLETGQLLWGPSEPEISWNYYGMNNNIYKGMLLSYGGGMAGAELIAYNITTGEIIWKYIPQQVGFESPYGNYPLMLAAVCDGKLYMFSTEHSPTQPLWRGSYVRCINATDGTEIWKILDWHGTYSGGSISDGYFLSLNYYDNQIYCIGKGPSATTVSAPEATQPLGTPVVIKGTVTDESPGAKGTPAIADEDQQAWMEYMYEQQAIPANAKGVEVSLDTLDPNGNFVHIGTATSDMSGTFSYLWTPEVPGKYTVIATFAGSKSYGSSYAETAMGVSEAPASATPASETTVQESPMLTYLLGVGIVIIILAVVAIVLLLRRK